LEAAQKVIRNVPITSPRFIRLILLLAGILSFVSAVFANSQILAFIGLGLTFWGALFFLITPLRYVEGSLLGTTAVSSYKTMNRMIKNLKLMDHGYHVPPFPENAYLPDHLKGLKEIVVFVPESNDAETPSIEEMAEGKFLLENPKGILVVPPGSGLLSRIEDDFKIDFTKMSVTDLCEILPRFILENLGLAEEMELSFQEERLDVKVAGSLYKGLYSDEAILRSVRILGCPIISAVACALAKATGKFVAVQNLQVLTNGQVKAECNIIQRRD
jgi:hypothetical protein